MKMPFIASVAIATMAGGLVLFAQVRSPKPVQVPNYRPVTEEMLRNPPPGDWLNWRRTDNVWGYSTLNEITRQNVRNLQLVWSWAMDDTGANEMTPLVHDGIMYLPNPGGVIQALDGATGGLIWECRPGKRLPPSRRGRAIVGRADQFGHQRNVAIFGDKIIGTTDDAHIVAVNAKTGKLEWDTTMADHALGFEYTSGPIVVHGKAIAGISGCNRYKKEVCFIAAVDANTGKEVWRTSSIALSGEPGDETWGGLAPEYRAGGDMWIPGSYDPQTNLLYWGTAQAKPWARAVRGTDGAALYTNSTLALDPDTGKMKWYYQYLPGDTQDMDEVFERILIDVDGRKSVVTMGKLGILGDRRVTGKFVQGRDLGY